MPKLTFTDAYIRGLKKKAHPYKVSEHAPKGEGRLMVRVLPSGVKEFFYRYRPAGGDKTLALGRYDPSGSNGLTLAGIRAKLRDRRELQRTTGDVKEHLEAEERKKQAERRKGTFHQLLDAYVESLRDAKKISADEAEGVFRRHVLQPFPSLASTKANEIQPDDIKSILGKMARAGIRRQVNVTRAYLRAAFAHGLSADHDPRTEAKDGVLFGLKGIPIASKPIREYERSGDRTLTDEELLAYWKGLDALPVVQRATLRFNLALACQRPTQLLRAQWSDFDFSSRTVKVKSGQQIQMGLTLLLRDSKGRGGSRDHLLPLTDFALEQLKPLRELNSAPDENDKLPPPFSSDSKRRMVLNTLSNAVTEVSDTLEKEQRIPKFDQRDLRRTAETMLQQLGVEKEVRAHLLSHGRTKGVQGKHYERYDFLLEKRAALEQWTDKLLRIIGANVLQFPTAA